MIKKSLPIDSKEIAVYEKQVTTASKFSTSLTVRSDEDYQSALTEGKKIKEQLDVITGRKEEITKPMNAALKSVRDLFKPLETAGQSALTAIKVKMLDYTNRKAREQEAAKLKIAQKVETGYYKPETAVEKMSAIVEQPKTVETEAGTATTRTVTKYRVTDIAQVPMKFHTIDMVAVKNAIKAGEVVAGIEIYQESELAFK